MGSGTLSRSFELFAFFNKTLSVRLLPKKKPKTFRVHEIQHQHSSQTSQTHQKPSSSSPFSIMPGEVFVENVDVPHPIAVLLEFVYFVLLSLGFVGTIFTAGCLLWNVLGNGRPMSPALFSAQANTDKQKYKDEESGEGRVDLVFSVDVDLVFSVDLEFEDDTDEEYMRRLY